MNESYIEYMIKKKTTINDILVRILFCLLCIMPVIFILQGGIVGVIAIVFLVAMIYFTNYVFKGTDLEYEYIYMSGELQFDKICGKSRRKGCGKLEMEKVEIIAHESSEKLEQYEKQTYKLRDFTSRNNNSENIYVAFQRNDSTLIKVMFEPNEAIIKALKDSAPRKVLIKGETSYY